MISYWITYGTNYIGGTGDTQSRAAWLVPITIQIAPAIILAVGIMFLPQSPRWAMDQGRDEECLQILAGLRNQPVDSQLVQLEYLEIKAQKLFETRVSAHDHPTLQDGSAKSNFLLGLAQYKSLITNRSNFKRTMVAVLVMTFQQWTGVNFILYYAPFIFEGLNLAGNTTSLLASGVVGIVMFLATIPAVLYLDKWGRLGGYRTQDGESALTEFSVGRSKASPYCRRYLDGDLSFSRFRYHRAIPRRLEQQHRPR